MRFKHGFLLSCMLTLVLYETLSNRLTQRLNM